MSGTSFGVSDDKWLWKYNNLNKKNENSLFGLIYYVLNHCSKHTMFK